MEPGEDDEVLNVLPTQGDAVKPILDLAPRVAGILQDVFSAVAIETPTADAERAVPLFTLEPTTQVDSPLSPVAGDAAQAESTDLNDPDSVIDEAHVLPSIQRRMFRTDI